MKNYSKSTQLHSRSLRIVLHLPLRKLLPEQHTWQLLCRLCPSMSEASPSCLADHRLFTATSPKWTF